MDAEKRARAEIAQKSTSQLIQCFLLAGLTNAAGITDVRGWLMDELEHRNPDAFSAWLDQDAPEDDTLRDFF